MKKVILILALLAVAPALLAQTPAPAPAPTPAPITNPLDNGWNVAINGNFSTANGSTNNGFALTEGFRVSQHFVIRADQYLLNSPDVTVALGGLEYRIPGTSIFKSSGSSPYAINASKLEFFVNGELGDAHATVASTAPITKRHFAVGIGGGFDLCVSATVCIRPLDMKYVNGGVMTNGGKILGNGLQFSAGLGIRF
jgi:hypothetical protein